MEKETGLFEKKSEFGRYCWKLWILVLVAFCVILYSSYKNMESFGALAELDDGSVLGVRAVSEKDNLKKLKVCFYGISDYEKLAKLIDGGNIFNESQEILGVLTCPDKAGIVEIAIDFNKIDKYVYFIIPKAVSDKKPVVLRMKNPYYKK